MFNSFETYLKNKLVSVIQLKTLGLLFIALLGWQIGSGLILPKASLEASDLTPDNILTAISKERTQKGLGGLTPDQRLAYAAQFKADDMMNRKYFSHTDPEGNYIWNKIVEAGYTPYLQLGENLAIEFYNTESLVSAWMNSPTHRANILNEGFRDTGLGLIFGDANQGKYHSAIANTFGALVLQKKTPALPLSSQPEPAPAPTPPVAQQEIIVPKEPAPSTQNQTPKPPKVVVIENSPPKESISVNENAEQNFALPEQKTPAPGHTGQSSEPVTPGRTLQKTPSAYDLNRYLMFAFAMLLVFLTISDLKKILEEKIYAYDKKLGNLVLVILCLIVIGLMYWL